MKYIDDLLEKLFTKNSNRAIIRENFTCSESENQEVSLWMTTEEGKGILKMIYDHYHLKRAGIVKQPEVYNYHTPYANGFAVTYNPPFTSELFSKLFLGLGQQVLGMGYRRISMDRKIEEINEKLITTERLYFKPMLSAVNPTDKISQLYGNVSIEKIYVDNKPNYLKVLVTLYSDRKYLEAKPFDQFIDKLFKAD